MRHTEEQKSTFKREFGVRRKRHSVLWSIVGPLGLGFLAYLFLGPDRASAALGLPRNIVEPAGYVLIMGGVLFTLWNMRCPACKLYLNKRKYWGRCPRCSVVLQ